MNKDIRKKAAACLSGLAVVGYGIYRIAANQAPPKYSPEWIKKLSDSQWETEREIVRQKVCSPKYDKSLRVSFEKILRLFDKTKNERDWAGQKPCGPSYRREHGYNLYKKD